MSHHQSNKLASTIHRTYPLDEELRHRMSQQRAESGMTMAAFLQDAIGQHLPLIIAELEAVGVPSTAGDNARPARLPLNEQLINALKSGTASTGIPATRLLAACLQRATK
jgi:hypothetical protein